MTCYPTGLLLSISMRNTGSLSNRWELSFGDVETLGYFTVEWTVAPPVSTEEAQSCVLLRSTDITLLWEEVSRRAGRTVGMRKTNQSTERLFLWLWRGCFSGFVLLCGSFGIPWEGPWLSLISEGNLGAKDAAAVAR